MRMAIAVGPEEASIDHLWPIGAKEPGARHEPRGVQLAHLRCNQRRGNRGPAQLRRLG